MNIDILKFITEIIFINKRNDISECEKQYLKSLIVNEKIKLKE